MISFIYCYLLIFLVLLHFLLANICTNKLNIYGSKKSIIDNQSLDLAMFHQKLVLASFSIESSAYCSLKVGAKWIVIGQELIHVLLTKQGY